MCNRKQDLVIYKGSNKVNKSAQRLTLNIELSPNMLTYNRQTINKETGTLLTPPVRLSQINKGSDILRAAPDGPNQTPKKKR